MGPAISRYPRNAEFQSAVQVLVKMHGDIMPHLTNPHLLTDFLSATLDTGGLHGILALHGIFTLVTKHGLEYPNFYRRLYNLLTPAALMVHSHQFDHHCCCAKAVWSS